MLLFAAFGLANSDDCSGSPLGPEVKEQHEKHLDDLSAKPTDGLGTEPAEMGPARVFRTSDGRNELYALYRAYPAAIEAYGFRDGEWAVLTRGRWFSWANGRMLPEEQRSDWERYQSYRFYDYPLDLPPVTTFTAREAEALADRVRESNANPPTRSEEFLSALLSASTMRQTEEQLERVEFLEFSFRMHRFAVPSLERVEADLLRLFGNDDEARSFFAGIASAGGYAYRSIAGQNSRSYHSYGLAVDFVPASYGGKFPYWRWAFAAGIERWWELGYEKRWMVPESIVEVFERYGFIWGGKWLYFDTIHFEYRPEVLLLARLRELTR